MKTQSQADNAVSELVDVLRDELAAHHKLLHLEMAKREAITRRDGEALKATANEQAQELYHIDLLDSRRDKLASQIMQHEGDVLLSQIIDSENISAPEKKELGRYQNALRLALGELKKISEVNTRMLIDSRDLFKTMLASLASSKTDSSARPRPVLVDANC